MLIGQFVDKLTRRQSSRGLDWLANNESRKYNNICTLPKTYRILTVYK